MDKEYKINLTEREIGLIMYAIEGYSSHAIRQAAEGKRDRKKTKDLTTRLCEIDSKLYQKILEIHDTPIEYQY